MPGFMHLAFLSSLLYGSATGYEIWRMHGRSIDCYRILSQSSADHAEHSLQWDSMQRLTLSQRLLIGSGVLFAGFVACQLSYAAIGQHIEKDGTLREPFFLIPISVLLLLGSSASLAGAALAGWRQGR